jgi:hypothetical protein
MTFGGDFRSSLSTEVSATSKPLEVVKTFKGALLEYRKSNDIAKPQGFTTFPQIEKQDRMTSLRLFR